MKVSSKGIKMAKVVGNAILKQENRRRIEDRNVSKKNHRRIEDRRRIAQGKSQEDHNVSIEDNCTVDLFLLQQKQDFNICDA